MPDKSGCPCAAADAHVEGKETAVSREHVPGWVRSAAAVVVGVCGPLVMAGGGCTKPDTRITLEQLRKLEQQTIEVKPARFEPQQLSLTELKPYTIDTGDVLVITMTGVSGEEAYTETTLRRRVYSDGTIRLPMVGAVKVAGLTLEQAEQAIINAHVPRYLKDLSVYLDLASPEETTVMVVGAAGQSGPVKLPRNERNVLYALARALGFSAAASGKVRVIPIDPQREVREYDLTDANDLRRALLAPPLQSGDMIVVEPAETSAVYLTGLVNAPGPISIPPHGHISLLRAIAAAGGVRDLLDPPDATLWRRLPDGRQVRVKLPLQDILSGKQPDIYLAAGDILEIPHTPETRLREWFFSNVRFGPFGVTSMFDPVAEIRFRDALDRSGNNRNFGRSALDNVLFGLPNIIVPPVPPPGQGP